MSLLSFTTPPKKAVVTCHELGRGLSVGRSYIGYLLILFVVLGVSLKATSRRKTFFTGINDILQRCDVRRSTGDWETCNV